MNSDPKDPLEDVEVLRMEAASDWLLRFHANEVSETDLAEWIQWCEADPANPVAFERIRSVWRGYDQLKAGPATEFEPRQAQPAPRPSRKWVQRPMAIGLAACLIAAIAARLWLTHVDTIRELAATDSNRSAVLPDGSSLELAANTSVAVEFSDSRRDLTMSNGQAYFKVRADQKRPFAVRAGDLRVVAIGTSFNVRQEPDRVIVTVEEGTVQAVQTQASRINNGTWQAGAGYQLVYSNHDHSATLAAVDPPEALAWRDGRLIYDSEPLSSVVNDVNHYLPHKIVIGDPRTAALTFTGTVFTASTSDWLSSVTTAFNLRIQPLPNGDQLIEAAQK